MPPTADLTAAQARRAVLVAQGFGAAAAGWGASRPTLRQVQGVIDRVGHFQIDTVNVAVRAQYMPLFARLGPYDRGLLDRAAGVAPRRLFEGWVRGAVSHLDIDLYPAFRHRMAEQADRPWQWLHRINAEHPDLLDKIRDQVARHGPLTARQIEHPDDREPGAWWNWSDAKTGLEWLLNVGELTVAGRNSQFERLYDFPHRVIPAPVLARGDLDVAAATRVLVARSAAALGVATERDLAGYFRLDAARARQAVAELVGAGQLEQVGVQGWRRPAFRWHRARLPRRLTVDALISPFDSLASDRDRLLQTFGVDYRIEIYVPAAKRVWGYYVYLFVMDDQITARVDLKADRQAGALLVQAAWLEPGAAPDQTAARLAGALRSMADWLELTDVVVRPKGTLADALAAQVLAAG